MVCIAVPLSDPEIIPDIEIYLRINPIKSHRLWNPGGDHNFSEHTEKQQKRIKGIENGAYEERFNKEGGQNI